MYTLSRTTGNAFAFGASIVSRLFDEAARLELAWANADLADDFGSRMVLATARYLARVGTLCPDGSHRSDDEQRKFAVRLLRRFWTLNARRDAARHAVRSIDTISLDSLLDGAGCASMAEPAAPDDFGGETGREAAGVLVSRGWSRERAWALVLFYATGEDYERTSALLAERFEATIANATLRQWKRRYFADGLAILAGLGEEYWPA